VIILCHNSCCTFYTATFILLILQDILSLFAFLPLPWGPRFHCFPPQAQFVPLRSASVAKAARKMGKCDKLESINSGYLFSGLTCQEVSTHGTGASGVKKLTHRTLSKHVAPRAKNSPCQFEGSASLSLMATRNLIAPLVSQRDPCGPRNSRVSEGFQPTDFRPRIKPGFLLYVLSAPLNPY